MYDAFGKVVSTSGTWSSHSDYGGKCGYQEDPDSGLKLLGHRYYDSSTGRFLTWGPIKDGRNWYSYCGNSPVDGVDPTGLVKVITNYYHIFGGRYLWFLVIIDNRIVSPTYGKRWYISGFPTKNGIPSSGIGLGHRLTVEVKVEDEGPYDFARPISGGVTLVNDQSSVEPWLEKARDRQQMRNNKTDYQLLSHNSNTVFTDMLEALRLVDEWEKAMKKRDRTVQRRPWSPGFHTWGHQQPGYWDRSPQRENPAGV
ncbi:RHS repeat-associated core domain-containing protein [Kamptonema cortianum]|nr:RHS repeat-associated core domain-containing protein [Kamptonema cortianum]